MPLTEQQIMYQRDLVKRAKNGDKNALGEYMKLNKGLTIKMVREHSKNTTHMDREDLYQEAMLGIMEGVKKFDFKRVSKTKNPNAYIFGWVRAYLSTYTKNKFRDNHARVVYVGGTLPAKSEHADLLQNAYLKAVDPESPGTDHLVEQQFVKDIIDAAVCELEPKEQLILRRRLLSDNPETLNEISKDVKYSREHIRHLETTLLEKLGANIKRRFSKQMRICGISI